jgi:Recombination, repair and ssDNA binding protein UvsY
MLEDYIKELEIDLQINELNLKDYQLRLPAVKHKWAGRCIRLKTQINLLKKQKDKIKLDIMSEIEHTSNVKLTQPTISATADRHSRIQDINRQIQEAELIVELLEKAEKTLNSCTYDVKNVIEIIKLETM